MSAQLGAEFYETEELDLELDDDVSRADLTEWEDNRRLERRRRRDERRVARRSRRGRLPPLNAEGQLVSSCLEHCLQRVPDIVHRLRTCSVEIRRLQRPQRWSAPPTSGQPSNFNTLLSLARRASSQSSQSRAANATTLLDGTTSRSAISPHDILDAESRRLRYAFNIDVNHANASFQINAVISTFERIQEYLNDESTFIHRLPSNDARIAGYACGTEDMPDGGGRRISQRRIFLGNLWFDAQSTPYYYNLIPCIGRDGQVGDTAAVVRTGILIHEAVHLHHGGEHSNLGRLRNPYAYGVYVMAYECGKHRLARTPEDYEQLAADGFVTDS